MRPSHCPCPPRARQAHAPRNELLSPAILFDLDLQLADLMEAQPRLTSIDVRNNESMSLAGANVRSHRRASTAAPPLAPTAAPPPPRLH